jgi:excisionase family DNA binding protein
MSRRQATTSPSSTPELDRLLTATQVAQRLTITVRTVDRLVEDGDLPCFRIAKSGHRRFKPDDVERLLVREKTADERADDLDDFITHNIKKG